MQGPTPPSISLAVTQRSRILDLYTLGRILGLIHLLINSNIKLNLLFPEGTSTVRRQRLHALGLMPYCRAHGIGMDLSAPSQEALFPSVDELRKAHYWHCLVPLTTLSQPRNLDPETATRTVSTCLSGIASDVHAALSQWPSAADECYTEISYLVFTVLRELLHNALSHSDSHQVTFALAMSCESHRFVRGARPSDLIREYPKFEFLVFDVGQGVLASIRTTLGSAATEALPKYLSSTLWEDRFAEIGAGEAALLRRLFVADLSVRKGRRSEGLSDVAEKLRWFDGRLDYRSGRTELELRQEGGVSHVEVTPTSAGGFLPGVIAAGFVRSKALQSVVLRSLAAPRARPRTETRCLSLSPLPKALFASGAPGPRRSPELEARKLASLALEASESLVEINLRLSEHLNVGLLDRLLQEFVKLQKNSPHRALLRRLLLTDVPRSVIWRLSHGTGASLLMLEGLFVTALDDSGHPHFLGVPRVSEHPRDVPEALELLFWAGRTLSGDELSSVLGLPEISLLSLRRLLLEDSSHLFYREGEGPATHFASRGPYSTVHASPEALLEDLSHFCVHEEPPAAYRLQNGAIVSSIVDFCQYWSDYRRVQNCARLLWAKRQSAPCDTVVTFINNGDRLATAYRQVANYRRFLVLDPTLKDPLREGPAENAFSTPFHAAVLVLDILYPGDDNGYVAQFLSSTKSLGLGTVHEVLCLVDARGLPLGQPLAHVPVRAVLTTSALTKEVDVASCARVLVNRHHYILSKPPGRMESALGTDDSVGEGDSSANGGSSARNVRYPDVELSTEFWHNVSELGLLASTEHPREERSVLFYEVNERLIENRRTRRLIEATIGDFVTSALAQKVDVILHPAHSVGAYLAQSVASKLPVPPLVLPLVQRVYGGEVEVSQADYDYFAREIQVKSRNRETLRVLVVDDSVLTGRSLLTMTGVARRLGGEVIGAFVLLNRLGEEVSEASDLLTKRLGYVFRLHMPVFRLARSPDAEIARISTLVAATTNSVRAHSFARSLSSSSSYLSAQRAAKPASCWVNVADCLAHDSQYRIHVREMDQVINALLLHPDDQAIDHLTRTAIAYNFFQDLVREPAFWRLLLLIAEQDLGDYSAASIFLEKTILLLSSSRHTDSFSARIDLERTLQSIVQLIVDSGRLLERPGLVTECFLAFARMESEAAFEASRSLLKRLGAGTPDALEISPEGIWHTDALGALAFAFEYLCSVKPDSSRVAAERALASLPKELTERSSDLALLDLLAPVLAQSEELRRVFSVSRDHSSDRLLDLISSAAVPTDSFRFLAEAPGYTCTLQSLLRITHAQSILLYARTSQTDPFSLIAMEAQYPKRSFDYVDPATLSDSAFPSDVVMAMKAGDFFVSQTHDLLAVVNAFLHGPAARWTIGAPVRTLSGSTHYFAVLGFSGAEQRRGVANSAYYYWTRAQAFLPDVLQSISTRHLTSARAWAIHYQAVRPIHALRLGAGPRRWLLKRAQAFLDLGDLVRRSNRMFAQPLTSYSQVVERVSDILGDIARCLKAAMKSPNGEGPTSFMPTVESTFSRSRDVPRGHHFTLPSEVLTFVLYECLWNALSYCRNSVTVHCRLTPDVNNPSQCVLFSTAIENDLNEPLALPADLTQRRGLIACKAAANAVGGTFTYPDDAQDALGVWQVCLQLPGELVPHPLEAELYGSP